MKKNTGTFLVVAAVILAGIVTLSYCGSTDAELSRYNGGWNGTSAFYDQMERAGHAAISYDTLSQTGNPGAIILVEPSRIPEETDGADIQTFVRNGGTLVVIAKNESANAILNAAGSTIRIDDAVLSSIDMEYADPRMVIAYPAGNHTLLDGIESIALNQPATVTGGVPLLKSSVISWIDTNNNGRADGSETFGKQTVMAHEYLGEGDVVVLSDSGILLNSMDVAVSERDNADLRKNLIGSANTGYDTTVSEPFATEGMLQAVTGAKSTTIIKIIAILLITGIICAAYARKIL